ncbi:MAG: hypothetical protein JWL99_4328 [Streptomyces oryziradicis]|nr:hypothetical protein [Actinacidiphila oryziradicis]
MPRCCGGVLGRGGAEDGGGVGAAEVLVLGAGGDGNRTFWPTSESGSYIAAAAPAVGIYSTKNSGGYLTKDGISYSARYVSAAAALLRAKYPSESAGQIIARLISTADRTDSMHGRDDRFGYGIVDPLKALQAPEPVSRANPLLNASGGSTSKAARQSTAMPWALAGIAAGTASVAVAGGFAVFRRRRSRTT